VTNLELAHQFIASMLCGDDEVSKAAHTAGKHYIRDFALWLDQRADEPSVPRDYRGTIPLTNRIEQPEPDQKYAPWCSHDGYTGPTAKCPMCNPGTR
jgi:hypothetical protein